MVELASLLMQPGQRGADAVGMSDERLDAALIVTHASSRVDLSERESTSRPMGSSSARVEATSRWRELGIALESPVGRPSRERKAAMANRSEGHVWINGEEAALGSLRSKDEVRVVDTFFRSTLRVRGTDQRATACDGSERGREPSHRDCHRGRAARPATYARHILRLPTNVDSEA
jgi:hypothetical protein